LVLKRSDKEKVHPGKHCSRHSSW